MLVEGEVCGRVTPEESNDKRLKLPDGLDESRDSGIDSGSVTCLCLKLEGKFEKMKEDIAFKEVMISALQESNQRLRMKVAAAENKAAELRVICEKHCSCCTKNCWPQDSTEKIKGCSDGFIEHGRPISSSTPCKETLGSFSDSTEIYSPVRSWKAIGNPEESISSIYEDEITLPHVSTPTSEDSYKNNLSEEQSGLSMNAMEDKSSPRFGDGWRLGVEPWKKHQASECSEKNINNGWRTGRSPRQENRKLFTELRHPKENLQEIETQGGEFHQGEVEMRPLDWGREQKVGMTSFSLVGDQGISITVAPTLMKPQPGSSLVNQNANNALRERSKLAKFLHTSDWRLLPDEKMYPEHGATNQGFRPWVTPSPSRATVWQRGPEQGVNKLEQSFDQRQGMRPVSATNKVSSSSGGFIGKTSGWDKLYECLDQADAYANKLSQGLSKIPTWRT